MVYQLKRLQTNERPQAFWGAFIPAAINFVGGLITSSQQAKAQRRALEEQQRLAQQQLNISNQNQLASSLNNYASAQQSYDDKDYNLKYRIGGVKRLGGRNIMITDGGNAKRIGNKTYLLRGGSHEDINETGQTGIGINVGGNEIEAEGGEVAQRKGNSLRIYSAQPILGGMSPAQAIMRGYNKDRVFNAQQRFKKNNGIKDDGSKATFGNLITMPFSNTIDNVIDYFIEIGKYAPKRVKVSNKTVNRKPIRNGQVGNFRVVNGKYFPNEKPLRQVYPEFDIICMGRDLPLGKAAKAIAKATKNEVSYINRISKSRLYSDNPIVNTYATYARKYNLPDKARVPYIIRRVKSDELPTINNGRITMSGDRFKHTNFTYDRPVVSHRKGKWDTAQQTYLINGRRLVSENKGNWGSIEPSDMFTIQDPKGGLTVPTKDVILVSGHKGLLGQAKASGIKIATSPQLQRIEKSITPRQSLGRFNLAGGERRHYNTPYWIDVNNIVKEYGTPKLKDVRLLEEMTGLKSGVSKLDNKAIKIINDANRFNKLKVSEAEEVMNQVYPNGRGVNFTNDREAYITGQLPYNNLFYDPTTYAESNYVFPKRLGGHCKFKFGGLTSKDRGSSKHPYPSVSSKDFAGGNRSYPIPNTGNTTRGNTIINHKTNVGYIYDKNGNYTGQADYSKVGNFNQAFDAARAAGRNQFIYRAGKYNNYSTVKETNAKKEALNRRIGARRIAKRMGGLTNPPVGSRRKYLPGGTANPWDKYRFTDYPTPNTWNEKYGISNVPDYGGTAPWQVSNKYAVNAPYPITKYDLPITTITAKKDTFNDEMSRRMRAGVQNLKDDSDSETTVPYLGKQSSFKPKAQDYIGLGIDTLAALGSGMFTRSAYNKMNFDYALPNYVDESPVAFDTTYHNEAQRANVERNRLNTRGLITGNTSSAQTALNLMQKNDTDAMMETNKLLDEKSNKEVELRNQNLANEQQVRARNAAARNQYYQNVAQIKNAALKAKNNMELAKAQSIGTDLSGLSQAWTNFASSVETRYNTRQNEAIIAATAKNPAVLSNAVQFGYNFSPEILAAIYNSTNDDTLKNLALSQLNSKNRRKYGIK